MFNEDFYLPLYLPLWPVEIQTISTRLASILVEHLTPDHEDVYFIYLMLQMAKVQ
jgi:hypothetical protein